MLLRNCVFVGVILLIATQVQGLEYLEDVIVRARDNMASYKSGKNFGKPVVNTKGIAVDVGKLNNKTFPLLPVDVKVAISVGYKKLVNISKDDYDYDKTISTLMQTQVLEPTYNDSMTSKTMSISDTTKTIVLNNWFCGWIKNPQFVYESHLNAGSSISMAKATMLIFKNLKNSCGGKSTVIESPIINLAVLQYPQPKTDKFVVNHVTLKTWVNCGGSDAGIKGEHVMKKFIPRYSVIAKAGKGSKDRAVAYIEGIFAKIAPKNVSANTDIPNNTSTSTCFSENSSTANVGSFLMSMLAAILITAI